MNKGYFIRALLLCLAVLTVAPPIVLGKAVAAKNQAQIRAWHPNPTSGRIPDLEQRLTPWLRERAEHRSPAAGAVSSASAPSDYDLQLIARSWDGLSKQFKDLYAAATRIPSWYVAYNSPGGNFEVYYAPRDTTRIIVLRDTVSDTTGVDMIRTDEVIAYGTEFILIDSIEQSTDEAPDTTDEYAFGAGGNWRTRTNTPNGVPDYIDEVAFALDSAWSMEVIGYGFPAPVTSQSSLGDPSRYKVIVTHLDFGYYGLTYPGPRMSGTPEGFTSHMEIRHDWSGPEWETLGYTMAPEKGAHVTCVHEFFHAIQYVMATTLRSGIFPDSYPLAWLEGSAVIMEETAFGGIDDYIQYSKDYFLWPGVPMLNDGYDPYFNGLLVLYLYYHALDTPDIGFVKSVFTNELSKSVSFSENLAQVAKGYGTTWGDLLNGFHSASYFTGTRADPGLFLPDAAKLPQWNTQPVQSPGTVLDSVHPFAMRAFAIRRTDAHGDTLVASFSGMGAQPGLPAGGTWSLSLILRANDNHYESRVLTLATYDSHTLLIDNWHDYAEAILVATNSHPTERRLARVVFDVGAEPFREGDTLLVYPNPLRAHDPDPGVFLEGKEITEARVYRLDGTLLSQVKVDTLRGTVNGTGWTRPSRYKLQWNATNAANARLSVGTYILLITHRRPQSALTRTIRKKLMVVP